MRTQGLHADRNPRRARARGRRARGGHARIGAGGGRRRYAEGTHARVVGRAEPARRDPALTAGPHARPLAGRSRAGRRNVPLVGRGGRHAQSRISPRRRERRRGRRTRLRARAPDRLRRQCAMKASMPTRRAAHGFTLIEILVALAILALTAVLAWQATAALVDGEVRLSGEATRWR